MRRAGTMGLVIAAAMMAAALPVNAAGFCVVAPGAVPQCGFTALDTCLASARDRTGGCIIDRGTRMGPVASAGPVYTGGPYYGSGPIYTGGPYHGSGPYYAHGVFYAKPLPAAVTSIYYVEPPTAPTPKVGRPCILDLEKGLPQRCDP